MFTDVRNPKWTGADHRTITLEVEQNGEWLNFVASPSDVTDYGPMLYHFAVGGKFGEVGASDEELIIAGELPIPEGYAVEDGRLVNIAVYEQEAQSELNRRLAKLNTEENKARAAIDEDYAAEWKAKIAAVLAVKQQPGWPTEVVWPQ